MERIDFSTLGAICTGENEYYSFSRNNNLLFIIDKNKNYLKRIDCLPGEFFFEKDLISEIIRWNNKLILIPSKSKSIYLYNQGVFTIIDISKYVDIDLKYKFSSSIIYNDIVYLFGHWAPIILGVDLKSNSVVFDYEIPDQYIVLKKDYNDAFFSNCLLEDGVVYLPFLSGGYIVKFDLEKKDIQWEMISEKEEGAIFGFKKDNNELVLFRRRANGLIVYNIKTNIIKEFFNDISFCYSMGAFLVGSKYLIPCYGSCSYLLDLEVGECDLLDDIKSFGVTRDNGDLYLIESSGLEVIDMSAFIRKRIELDFSNYDSLLKEKYNKFKGLFPDIIIEESQFGLKDYLDAI